MEYRDRSEFREKVDRFKAKVSREERKRRQWDYNWATFIRQADDDTRRRYF